MEYSSRYQQRVIGLNRNFDLIVITMAIKYHVWLAVVIDTDLLTVLGLQGSFGSVHISRS